jgi:short-subunit dehydrogenase
MLRAMQPPLDGTVVITGASSGIGREMARQLASTAKRLVLVARRADRLEALADELRRDDLVVDVEAVDLADLEATEALAVRLLERGVDVLINNAGLGDMALYDQCEWERITRMNRVNVDALMLLTHRLLPPMVAKGSGGILNVSSGFGMTPMPVMSTYVATKHYVTAFTESLRMEMAGTGVIVSQVCPGPVATEFEQVAGNPFDMSTPKAITLTPEACARAALAGFRRRKALIVPGFVMGVVMAMGRMTPRWVFRAMYGPLGRAARKRLASG